MMIIIIATLTFLKKIALKTESGGRYEHVEVDILLIPNSTARWMRQISGD